MNRNVQDTGGTAAARAQTPQRQQDFRDNRFENASNNADDNFVELKYRSTSNFTTAGLARGLGIFSIALGLAEVLMPSQLGELAGISRRHRAVLPALGFREIAHGLGIMRNAKPTGAVWTRVGGDVLDLAYLGASFISDDSNKRRLVGATAAVLGVAALDLIVAKKLSSQNWQQVRTNPLAPTTLGQPSGRRAFIA